MCSTAEPAGGPRALSHLKREQRDRAQKQVGFPALVLGPHDSGRVVSMRVVLRSLPL